MIVYYLFSLLSNFYQDIGTYFDQLLIIDWLKLE